MGIRFGRIDIRGRGWVLKKEERYTILLVPQTGGPMKKISFSEGRLRLWRRGLVAVGALLVANLAVFVYLYFIDHGNIFQYLSFKSENARLRAEQKKEMRNLRGRLLEVEEQHQKSLAQMAEIETITGFRNFDPKLFLTAKGGPEQRARMLDAADPAAVKEVRQTVETIDGEHKEVSERLQKIQLFVRANEERMRLTPAGWPVNGWISSAYGWRSDPWSGRSEHHDGIDISAWYGTPIRAVADGTVRTAGRYGGLGQVVVLTHRYGYETYYGHMSRVAARMKATVKRGEIIGYVGSSGRSTGAHAHYEIRVNNRPVDPWPYLGLMP